ncbi:MAG: helix-turn-helix domain-containing protein [Bacteroidota bacterium]
MDIHFSFIDILNLIGLLLGLLYTFQIVTLKNRTVAIRFFSFYLLNITFIIFFYFLLRIKLDFFARFLTPLLVVSVLMMPINLWVYQKKLIFNDDKRNFKHYLVPVISGAVILALLLPAYFVQEKESKVLLVKLLTSIVLFLLTAGFLVLNIIYLVFSFNLLRRHRRNIRNFYSYTHKVDLEWVRVMLYGYLFLLVGLIITELVKGKAASDLLFYIVLDLYIIYTGHNALKQKEVWTQVAPPGKEGAEKENALPAENETFTESQQALFRELKTRLLSHMEEEKPYLDQDLTILKLAKDLQTNSKYLSHVINSEFNRSFIHFINDYRINELKQQLVDNRNYTIEALAQNAGFKSKSSFNAAFKKSTGLTPSIYLRQQVN